jgi:hypothetical protein
MVNKCNVLALPEHQDAAEADVWEGRLDSSRGACPAREEWLKE